MRLFNKKKYLEESLKDIENLEKSIKNKLDIDMKNRTLEIAKEIIKKEEEIPRIQNIIDEIMSCDSFIIRGYENKDNKHQGEVKIHIREDGLREYLTEKYRNSLNKLIQEIDDLKSKL